MRHPSYRTGLLLLLAPFLTGAVVLVLVPALVTSVFAFTRYDGLGPPELVGLDTFRGLLSYGQLRDSLGATALFLLLAVPLRIAGGLALALLMLRRERLAVPGRLASYTPSVLPDAVVALVLLWAVNPVYGPVAAVVRLAGGTPGPVLLDPWGARLVIVTAAVLALGEGFLVTLAARREVPEVLYDVARLEGARGAGLFRRVTLPALAPVLGLLSARDLVVSMQVTLVPVLLLTRGGPLGATTTLPALAYERGFRELEFGDAAAIGVLLLLATVAVVAVQAVLLRRWTRGGAVVPGGA